MVENTTTPIGIKPRPSIPLSNDKLVESLLRRKAAVLVGGLSLLGKKGYIVRLLSIMKPTMLDSDGAVEQFQGWCFYEHYPILLGFGWKRLRYIDAAASKKKAPAIPNTIIYVAAEVDPSLVEKNVNKKQLQEIITWTLSQIHD